MEAENGVKQLFISNIKDSQSIALTNGMSSVVDFALSPDNSQVIYIVQTDDLKNEIWLVDINTSENKKISDCSNAICSQPVWAPNGSQVILEHIDLSLENVTGLATLWQIDMQTGEMKPLFQSEQLPGANARWSPDGKWLSYATADNIRLYNLDSGETHVIKSILGASAAWAPDAKSVLYRDVIIQNGQFVTQLFVYDLETGKSTNIKPDIGFENILAAWSPNGEWIAVVRRDLSIARGDQIWLMRPDGSDAHVVTNTPNALHGTLNWSEDGKYILYDLYNLDIVPLTAKLQMVNVDSQEINDPGIFGYNPKWVK
jgi:Tol biopolymer transport system component